MSLFQCVDLLDDRLRKLNNRPYFLDKFLFLFSATLERRVLSKITKEKELVVGLKQAFEKRIEKEDYSSFSEQLNLINEFNKQTRKPPKYLKLIMKDLEEMLAPQPLPSVMNAKILHQLNQQSLERREALLLDAQRILQIEHYKIANIEQGDVRYSHRLGTSKGECFGFSNAMVDPILSPYKNPELQPDKSGNLPVVHLNRQIHDYQRHQGFPNREIKQTRLTRQHFCPTPLSQAKAFYALGLKHQGAELAISLSGYNCRHRVYFSVLENEIRYMDPNWGAFRFASKDEFIAFYFFLYKEQSLGKYHFYLVNQLFYDKEDNLSESKTFKGKIRTLLTGTKYSNAWLTDSLVLNLPLICIGIGIAAIAGISPVGPLIFIGVEATWFVLSFLATKNGSQGGILAIPFLLQKVWYLISKPRETDGCRTTSELNEEQTLFSSTRLMMKKMWHNDTNPTAPLSSETQFHHPSIFSKAPESVNLEATTELGMVFN